MSDQASPPPPTCPDCGGPAAGTVNDRFWCCLCARELDHQHKRRVPGIAVPPAYASIPEPVNLADQHEGQE